MRQRIELVTTQDIEDFINNIQTVSEDVRLEGLDENGCPWQVSVKSTLGELILKSKTQRDETNVDWNTIECICNKDIYSLISKWAVGSQMEG